MHWVRQGVMAAILAALVFLTLPVGQSPGQDRPGLLERRHCGFRVYFRRCLDGPWDYYATYNDCHKAQYVVEYLRFRGCDAYYRSI